MIGAKNNKMKKKDRITYVDKSTLLCGEVKTRVNMTFVATSMD